nr:hypothetical protein [Anaerolineae bacterium]
MTTLLQRALLALSALMGLMTVGGILVFPHHLNPDVGLYLEMGQKVLDGQHPYVDYEEVNFPMIHWLNVLPAILSRLTGLPPTITFQVCMLGLIMLVCGLLWRLLSRQTLMA